MSLQPEHNRPIKVTFDCIPCAIGSLITLFKNGLATPEQQESAMRALLDFLSKMDYNQSPPQMGREMHRMIRGILNNPDPYADIKQKFNQLMLDYYPRMKKWVTEAVIPFRMAMQLAIAGNVIDYGPNRHFDIDKTLEMAKSIVLAIDDSRALQESIDHSKVLLYLGDNAGEIVVDRIFLETINHPNVYFAVRGAPVINDALIEDAKLVGIDRIAHIISNGDDAPGTILVNTSAEFRDIFQWADLVISKGQGNYEGLISVKKNIYFILMTKCDHVAGHLGVKKGAFIVKRAHNL